MPQFQMHSSQFCFRVFLSELFTCYEATDLQNGNEWQQDLGYARVLKISPTIVIEALKKDRHLEQVNQSLLEQIKSTAVIIVKHVEEAEADEIWSFVQSKKQER